MFIHHDDAPTTSALARLPQHRGDHGAGRRRLRGRWPLWRDASFCSPPSSTGARAGAPRVRPPLESWLVERSASPCPRRIAYAAVGSALFDLPHLASGLCSGTLSFDKVQAAAAAWRDPRPTRDGRGRQGRLGQGAGPSRPLVSGSPNPEAEAEQRGPLAPLQRHVTHAHVPNSRGVLLASASLSRGEGEDIPPTGRPAGTTAWPTPWSRWSPTMGPDTPCERRFSVPSRPKSLRLVAHVPIEILFDPRSTLCGELERGGLISAETLRRLACDATLIVAVDDDVGHTIYEGRGNDWTDARPSAESSGAETAIAGSRVAPTPPSPTPHHIESVEAGHGPDGPSEPGVALCPPPSPGPRQGVERSRAMQTRSCTSVGPTGRVMTSRPSIFWTQSDGADRAGRRSGRFVSHWRRLK